VNRDLQPPYDLLCKHCKERRRDHPAPGCSDCSTLRARWLEREKESIRRSDRRLVRLGDLPRRPCAHCRGTRDLQLHHLNYRLGSTVWLCRPCHRLEHATRKATGRSIPFKYRLWLLIDGQLHRPMGAGRVTTRVPARPRRKGAATALRAFRLLSRLASDGGR
jgi:hypothetical protein